MKRAVGLMLLALGPLTPGGAVAASLAPVELERVVFQSMMMSPDPERVRLGLRMFFLQFPNDVAACDYVAERLLKEPPPKNGHAADTAAWYVRTLNESCPPRDRFSAAALSAAARRRSRRPRRDRKSVV